MIQPLRDRILVRPIERKKSDILAVIMQENPNMGEVVAVGPGEYDINLLHSASCAHVYHWQTTSYSAHKALGKFYEAMPDLVDGLVETYMGRNGIFGEVDKEQEVYMDKDPLAYMKALRSYVDDTRKDLPQDSEIQNLIDGITDLINTTIYKLENLK